MVRRFGADRFGGVAVAVALALPVLIGFGALGTEVGMWLLTQRRMQGAADAAAVSATFARTSLTTMQNQAYAVAAQNGFSNGVSGVTVTVNNPPASPDPYHSNPKAIEVIIAQPQGRLFSALFLGANPTVSAHAVVAPAPNGGGCMLALGGGNSIQVSGNGHVVLQGCDADGNGNLLMNGSPSNLAVNTIDITGTESGQGTLTSTQTPTYNDPTAFTDPYAARSPTPQSVVAAIPGTCVAWPGTATVAPGCYKGGFTITSNVTLSAGRYYIDGKFGGFNQTGGTVSGTGVSIILTSSTPATVSTIATIAISGNSVFSITAPSDGSTDPLDGIAIIQDNRASTTSTGASFSGQAAIDAVGAFYFPSSTISFSGNNVSVSSACLQLVGLDLSLAGNATFQSNCVGTGVAGFGRDGAIRLVE
jgi:hypothetical protein